MKNQQIEPLDIDLITLARGIHPPGENEFCAMELVAYIAGSPHSDHPSCASVVIGAFVRKLNDGLADEERQQLKPYLRRIIGTGQDGADQRRAWMAIDWIVREHTAIWLEHTAMEGLAVELRACSEIIDIATLQAAQQILNRATSAAESAARSAAEFAALSAARSAALSAARSATEFAALFAAESAARSAALSAARSAAEFAARSAARSAAAWSAAARSAAAWSAAESAAESAARSDALSAALSAARSSLLPKSADIQLSAFRLLDRMIDAKAPKELETYLATRK